MRTLYIKHPGRALNTSELGTLDIFGGKYNGIFRTRRGTQFLAIGFNTGDIKGCAAVLSKRFHLESYDVAPVK